MTSNGGCSHLYNSQKNQPEALRRFPLGLPFLGVSLVVSLPSCSDGLYCVALALCRRELAIQGSGTQFSHVGGIHNRGYGTVFYTPRQVQSVCS
jgi:hypothetical protein